MVKNKNRVRRKQRGVYFDEKKNKYWVVALTRFQYGSGLLLIFMVLTYMYGLGTNIINCDMLSISFSNNNK